MKSWKKIKNIFWLLNESKKSSELRKPNLVFKTEVKNLFGIKRKKENIDLTVVVIQG